MTATNLNAPDVVQTSSYDEIDRLQIDAIRAHARRLGRPLSILEAGCGQRWTLDLSLSTMSSVLRAEGAGLYSLSRNIGSSVGISVVNSLLTQNTQVNHAEIVQHVTAVNRIFGDPIIAQFWNPLTAAGRAALDAMITRQAQIIAYIDDYKLLMIATLAVIPLLIVFKQASDGGGEDHTLVVE